MDKVGITESDNFIIQVSEIITYNEGYYDTINRNDGTSSSIGILQWNGYRAKNLLKIIISKNEEQAKAILDGTTILADINKDDDFWNSKILDDIECEKISELLRTEEGMKCQYELRMRDVKAYINHGKSLGIKDEKALAYFADLENQLGCYMAENIIKSIDSGKELTIYEILQASVSYSDVLARKQRPMYTYKKIMNTAF
ncbi:hypothetical protein CLRAG_21420 [Clostridium ragsdalei P11]|uniref:Uncharacterized protein n=2 Tax=Clostridium TaxID=1485 RepID=A0A1A6AS05_9CLOT|nr:hypothetical protein [Clostridium ragsdalei]OBR92849.1 hypothetical protein CLRAG_21420 [Clostridium ragsdalei P11]